MRNDYCSNYLAHHGILGQKWGIRRYQNPDGSLTEAGRKRYGVGEGEGIENISSEKGRKNRAKDLNKAIKINDKKRGKEYTKIANNPENFLGLNKKHARKISEYSENIKKGEAELEKLFAKDADEKAEKNERNAVISGNKSEIASSIAKDMVKDLKRWQKEDGVKIHSSLEGKSDSQIEKILTEKIEKKVSSYNPNYSYKHDDDVFDFVIDGIPEYSDSAPLTVEYNKKTKKVIDFYYT